MHSPDASARPRGEQVALWARAAWPAVSGTALRCAPVGVARGLDGGHALVLLGCRTDRSALPETVCAWPWLLAEVSASDPGNSRSFPRSEAGLCPGRIRTCDARFRKPTHPTDIRLFRRNQLTPARPILTPVASDRHLFVPTLFPH